MTAAIKDRSFRIHGDNGKGVMLIHGLTGAPQEMKSVGRVLHKRGFSLDGPMLAGHGGTEADVLATDWRDWVDSAAAAYERFAREVDEVYVAGICAGGAIGLELCARFPEIKGAAVYSMLFEYDGWNMPKITLGAPVIQAVANLPLLRSLSFVQPHPYGFKDERLRGLAENALESLIPGALDRMPLGCMYQLYRLARHVEQIGAQITAPVLIGHAREDDMANLRNAYRLAAALGGPSEVVVLEDSYHMIHVDREHARLAELTAGFFGGAAPVAQQPRGPRPSMPDIAIVDSLRAVDRAQWEALSGQGLEGYDYLSAVEDAGLPGFAWRYVLASEDGRLVAAAPAFLTDYALETTLVGPGKQALDSVRKVFPRAFKLRLACMGSPCTGSPGLGFAPQVASAKQAALLGEMLAAFEREARANRCGLLALKDVAEPERALWDAVARPLGYRPMASLPIAALPIDFPDVDAYLAALSYTARKDMRRKLRTQTGLRVAIRTDVDDLADQLMDFYEATRARADMAFEELTAAYFTGVPRAMPGRAFWVLYFEGEALVGANLLLQDETTLVDKYILTDPVRGRALNLYFVSWFNNIRLCLDRGLKRYQPGQAAYENKLRLGCGLTRTSIYFRHGNGLVNGVMQLFAPIFAADTAGEAPLS